MLLLISTIFLGIVAGVVAKVLTPEVGPSGYFLASELAIAGAFIASFLAQRLELYPQGHAAEVIAFIIGAIALPVGHHLVTRHRAK